MGCQQRKVIIVDEVTQNKKGFVAAFTLIGIAVDSSVRSANREKCSFGIFMLAII